MKSSDRPVLARTALPYVYVDLILDGVPAGEATHRRLYGVCVSIAMSTQRRGWSEAAYTNEIARDNSHLWLQLQTGRGGKRRSPARAYEVLTNAWLSATENLHDLALRTAFDIAQDARERALQWTDRLTDRIDQLSDAEMAVMAYVVSETERRGMLRVTCPGRDAAHFAKLSHRSAARTLSSLAEKGFLIKHFPGRRGTPSVRKAAIYGLADPDDPRLGAYHVYPTADGPASSGA